MDLKNIMSTEGMLEYIIKDLANAGHNIEALMGCALLIMSGIAVLLVVGIAILINQRKIKKQLKKLLEEKDKP